MITSKTQHPYPSWERFVVTGKARACTRRFVRQQMHQQFAESGKAMLQQALRREHLLKKKH